MDKFTGNNKGNIIADDFENIISSCHALQALRGSSILISGATGLVGSLLGRFLIYYNENYNAGTELYLLIRSPEKAASIYGDSLKNKYVHTVESDITGDIEAKLGAGTDIDYFVHAASVTSSRLMIESPVETIETSLIGTNNILKAAMKTHCKAFLYLSSMEMYGSFQRQVRATEDVLGRIDPLRVRSNYPESKRMCENMCVAYMKEHGLDVKIARLAQTFGAGVLKGENRVFAQFARSVRSGEDIILHTKGLSEGNYCYSGDVISALVTILVSGKAGEAYNVSNEEMHTTIADMAEIVCENISGGRSRVIFDIPENNVYGYAADTRMILDSSKLRALGWEPTVGLLEAYKRMISYMDQAGY